MPTVESLVQAGYSLFSRGDLAGARLHYLAALELDRNSDFALGNLSVLLGHEAQLVSMVSITRRLLARFPQNGGLWNNLGNALMRLERYEESLAALEHAKVLVPDDGTTWYNLALIYLRIDRYADALDCMERMEGLGTVGHKVTHDKAHALLALGDLPTALELYESRWWSMAHLSPWDFHIPEWKGEPISGRKILFHAEQGYGDTIMTARFARDLVDCGAQVTMALPPDLVSLFSTQNWPGVEVIDLNSLNPDLAQSFDFQSPMYSAMRWLGITRESINPAPYLTSLAPRGGPQILQSNSVYNVGICWASGVRGGEMDWRRRYAPLEFWLPLAELPDIQLYSLQKGPDEAEIADLGAEALIIDPTASFRNWADTANFVSQLDLVITVDTAVAHLAGALGKPVWMLSQFANCWRWWNIKTESGLPWYSTMTIIRQRKPKDWQGQLEAARERLRVRHGALRAVA